MRASPPTPFPFPDPPAFDPVFPAEPPLDAPIWTLSTWWLDIRCDHCGRTVLYPLRLMSARVGWDVTLGQASARLRCPDCRRRPSYIALVERAAQGPGRHNAADPKRLILPA